MSNGAWWWAACCPDVVWLCVCVCVCVYVCVSVCLSGACAPEAEVKVKAGLLGAGVVCGFTSVQFSSVEPRFSPLQSRSGQAGSGQCGLCAALGVWAGVGNDSGSGNGNLAGQWAGQWVAGALLRGEDRGSSRQLGRVWRTGTGRRSW
jgi:hypothetical protein